MRRYSPYNYAFDNPIRFIDPDGMAPTDDYKLNRDGRWEWMADTDDETDKLYATNEDGSVNKEKSIEVEKGILDDPMEIPKNGNRQASTTLPTIKDKNKAVKLFEFLASNSDVEWGYITIGQEATGLKAQETRIITNHVPEGLQHMTDLIDKYIGESMESDRKIFEVTHSHAESWADFPSGFYRNGTLNATLSGDRQLASYVEYNYRKNLVLFSLYVAPKNEYIYYNSRIMSER